MWKVLALGIGLALAPFAAALADSPPATDSTPPAANSESQVTDSRLAAAMDLLEAQNAKANMKLIIDTFMKLTVTSLKQSHPDLSDDKIKLFTEAFTDEMKSSLDDLVKLQAQVYARHFSEDELHALAAFYRTDVGKKYISEVPQIVKETVPLGLQWGQSIAPKAAERAIDRLKKEGVQL
jgi:hypothetical protein